MTSLVGVYVMCTGRGHPINIAPNRDGLHQISHASTDTKHGFPWSCLLEASGRHSFHFDGAHSESVQRYSIFIVSCMLFTKLSV